jgi:hypothetical protein
VDEKYSEVSPLARTLLAVAWKNDRQKKLTGNAALRLSLHVLQRLVSACKENDAPLLAELTGQSETPRNFLSFAASVANEIDLKLQARVPGKESSSDLAWASTSDFDHSVFLALGQALADAVWPQSAERDLHAPGIEKVLKRLVDYSERDVQVALIQHYLGNVLHDYFDRAQVRVAVRDLPDDVELEIRRDDCRAIAYLAYQIAESQEGQPPTPQGIQAGLSLAIESILENKSS